MNESTLEIRTPDGVMPTFTARPRDGGPFPVVIIYMDVWGVREELFDIARRVASVGYYCVVPDLYYRQGRVRNAFRNESNQMISLELLSDEQKEIVRAPLRKLTDAMVVSDTDAILAHLDSDPAASKGPVGCIGYCMGGRHVFRVAAAYPDRFKACASLHGTNLATDAPDSPHLQMAECDCDCDLYCGFAQWDKFASPATVEALAQTLRGTKVNYRYEIHPDADHGYALPDRDIHDRQAANRDWEIIFGMLRHRLGS